MFGLRKDHDLVSLKKEVLFSMDILKAELGHECCPKHLSMRTARIKYYKGTEEKGKQR